MRQIIACLLLTACLSSFGLNITQAAIYPVIPTIATEKETDEKTVVIAISEGNVEDAIETVKATFPTSKVRKTYERVLNGFSIELLESEVDMLRELKEIKRVDKVVNYTANLDSSVPFIGGGEMRSILDAEGERVTGKGVKVAVIDTGIDYTHPDLARNYKGGYDVIDYDDDPMETLAKQGLPTLHGTHVAGIIGANGQLKGVAPEVDLYAYRALGPGGQGTTEQVIEAIEKAVEDGVDVINLSLGNSVNGPDWPTSLALDQAVDQGIVAVTSNGNSGPNMWTVGSPGTSTKAISVGASAPPLQTPYITLTGLDKEISLYPIGGALPWTLKRDFEVVDAGYGMKEEFEQLDVNGKVVIIKRGLIPFSEKANNAKEVGAKAVLIYNNLSGAFVGAIELGVKLPVVSISKEDGDWLVSQIKEQKDPYVRTIYRHEEDFIAPFSSRGPVTNTWEVKPDLVAPGISIDSTVPKGYLGLNGTSMSSPHVAGAAALIKQVHPDWSPEQVKAVLMNTTKKLTKPDGEPYLPFEQGTGRLQVDKAIRATTIAYPAAVTFGKWTKDDPREKRQVEVTIENHDNVTRTYHVNPPFAAPDGLDWQVPFATTLKPGESKKVSIHLDLLPAVLAEGMHHGDIIIDGGREEIRIPYVFFIEEPDYPRVMAFNFGHGDSPGEYRYELYLPGGAEEMAIALYDPDTFEFIRFLDVKQNVGRGMVEGEWKELDLPNGAYKALVYAKKDGKEDTLEAMIMIGQELPPRKKSQE